MSLKWDYTFVIPAEEEVRIALMLEHDIKSSFASKSGPYRGPEAAAIATAAQRANADAASASEAEKSQDAI